MKDNRIKNSYLVSCVCSILLLLTICYFGLNFVVKETFAGFGGLSGCMLPTIPVNYVPNYPDGVLEPEVFVKMSCEAHKVLDNMFEVPDGYEFNGWNSMPDGSGKILNIGVFTMVSEEATIYAQWKELPKEEPEEEVIKYGDVNQNGLIDEGDYLLIETYLDDSTVLTDNLLTSADVNGDGKIDEVDVDIVKQVCLGTDGYVGYLPLKIVPIYSIYKNDENSDNNDVTTDDGEGNISGSGTGDGTGTGTGSGEGNASGSTGGNTSTGGTSSSGSSNKKPNNNGSSNNGGNTNKKPDTNKEEPVEPKKVVYKFDFINDNKEYASTSCETIEGNACEMTLPKENPIKKNAIFVGWDTNSECSSVSKINKSLLVKGNGTYYACFIVNAAAKKDYSVFTVGLIIFMIWVCAIFTIYLLVKRFKNTEVKG